MLISPSEPKQFGTLGKVSSTPERHGADFLILGYKVRIGVQRKQFPGDLLASLQDGRLYDQLPRLGDLDKALLIVEGRGRWTLDGELMADKYHQFTLSQMHGLLFTVMFEFGVPSIWVANMDETIAVLRALESWSKKKKHTSLKSRPGPEKNLWGSLTDKHMAQHIMQGFPGVGPELASRMIEKFECVPLTWTVGMDELMSVEGIGKKKAEAMYGVLEELNE